MIWFPPEGGELRNGVNLQWSRGPIVYLAWFAADHMWCFRIRVRWASLDHRLHLILRWTSGDIVERHEQLGLKLVVNRREWSRDYSWPPSGAQAA